MLLSCHCDSRSKKKGLGLMSLGSVERRLWVFKFSVQAIRILARHSIAYV